MSKVVFKNWNENFQRCIKFKDPRGGEGKRGEMKGKGEEKEKEKGKGNSDKKGKGGEGGKVGRGKKGKWISRE